MTLSLAMLRVVAAGLVVTTIAWGTEPPAASTATSSAPAPPRTGPPLAKAVLAPGLKAAAERDGIKLQVLGAFGEAPAPGDSVVAWVGAHDGRTTRQWLVQLRRAPTTPAEQRRRRGREQTKYLSWGPVITFKSDPEVLEVWLAGPVDMSRPEAAAGTTPARVKRLRVSIPGDYLRLGLDESARVDLHITRRVQRAKKEGRELAVRGLYALERPIKPEHVERSKAVAAQFDFTPEMSRAWCGGYVALRAFFEAVEDVPELRAIAEMAVDRPSMWKIATTAFRSKFVTTIGDTRIAQPARLGHLPVETEAYLFRYLMRWGKDPIVHGEMLVTSPTSPLDVSAGILGFVATHPKEKNRQVQFILIGSQAGPPVGSPPVAAAP